MLKYSIDSQVFRVDFYSYVFNAYKHMDPYVVYMEIGKKIWTMEAHLILTPGPTYPLVSLLVKVVIVKQCPYSRPF